MDIEIFKRDYAQARTFVNPNAIPDKLKQHLFWNLWKYEYDAERPKPRKTPYDVNANRKRGKSTDTTTFDIFSKANTVYQADNFYSGLGIGIFGNICGIDIDNCLDENGTPSELAQDFINTMQSYTEISPSGKGIRIFVFINETFDKERYKAEYKKKNDAIGLEIYIGDTTGRYLTITGNIGDAPEPMDIADRTTEVIQMLDKYMKKEKNNNSPTSEQKQLEITPTMSSPSVSGYYPENFLKTVADVLEHAMNAKNSDKFNRLFKGDISGYESHSQADQAFCNLLAFYSGCDENLMDATFRESGLIRKKWDEKHKGNQTYGEMTIETAIASCTEVYNPQKYANAHNNNKTNSADLPNWILETNRGLRVSPERLARHIQDTEHYYLVQQRDKDDQRFFWYQGGIYSRISTALVKSRIREIISEHGIDLATVPAIENTYKQLTYPEVKHYLSSDTLLDADENIIVFQNGVLHLDTLELKQHSPDFKVTRKIPCNWNPDVLSKNLLFDSYIMHLAGNDVDCAKTLIEAIGFAISNVKISHYKAGIVLYGSGNTGKTMFLKFIKKLIGEENYCSMPFENLSKRFSISKLYKKRFAADDDCNYCSRSNISYFKSLTSGAPMDFEEKGKDATTFEYDGLYFICANKLPLFTGDKGDHVYKRFIPIRCGDSIPPNKRDDKLLEKLYAEREAIVFAAVHALKDTISRGHKFTVSATSESLLQEFKQENDIVYQFIAECCEPLHNDKAFDVTAQNLYVAFGNWCDEQGEHYKMKKSEFKQSLCNYLKVDEKKLEIRFKYGRYYPLTLTAQAIKDLKM